MKFFKTLSAFAWLWATASAYHEHPGWGVQMLITFAQEIPDDKLAAYRRNITAFGGEILSPFHLIKGFIVKVPTKAKAENIEEWVESIAKSEPQYSPTIAEDRSLEIEKPEHW